MSKKLFDKNRNKLMEVYETDEIVANPELEGDEPGLIGVQIGAGTYKTPEVGNATITITQGGVEKGSFTTNQNVGQTIELDAGGGGSTVVPNSGSIVEGQQDLNYVSVDGTNYTIPFHIAELMGPSSGVSFPTTIYLSSSQTPYHEIFDTSGNVAIQFTCNHYTQNPIVFIVIPVDKQNGYYASSIITDNNEDYYYSAVLNRGTNSITFDKKYVSSGGGGGSSDFITLSVQSIKGLTDAQITDLSVGDVVCQTTDNHLYYLTSKTTYAVFSSMYTSGNQTTTTATIHTVIYYNDFDSFSTWEYNSERYNSVNGIDVYTGSFTSTWSEKTWSGLTNFSGEPIWTDGENIYYSDGSSGQYVLDRATSTWKVKTWSGLSYPFSPGIWEDGKKIYYSNSSDQYVLDKSTSTWSAKVWSGLTNFDGGHVWTDGTNIYYSNYSNQYVLDRETSTWSAKVWSGFTDFDGSYIWTDGDNIYYSYGASYRTDQYVLDRETSTWSRKTWNGLTNFYGNNIWTDGENIYYSSGSSYHYVLNKATSTWETKTWNGLTSFYAESVWKDGGNIYYSGLAAQYVLNRVTEHADILEKVAKTGDYNDLYNKPKLPVVNNADITFTQGGVQKGKIKLNQPNSQTIEFDAGGGSGEDLLPSVKTKLSTSEQYWETIPSLVHLPDLAADYVWTDGSNIYYSSYYVQLVFNTNTNEWENKSWSGLTGFSGQYIWTDGENIYYSFYGNQCVLDKSTSTWSQKVWYNKSDLIGADIWTDGNNIYYSAGSEHYVLDKATSAWNTKTWNELTDFYGQYIWTDGNNIYCSNESMQYVLDVATSTWSAKEWQGLTSFNVYGIWTDGEDIYYSADANQYVLDVATSTWNEKIWGGSNLVSFEKNKIWTDGNDFYYSVNKLQRILDVRTHTWKSKTWSGKTSFNGEYIWTDGTNIYYSYEFAHYVLNKSTSTWSEKTWNGYSGFRGDYIWTDGENIYYSFSTVSNQYVLNKATSTWNKKTWNGFSGLDGKRIWKDGENIYYSDGSNQYVLDKATSTWSVKTWSGITSFNGQFIWTDGTNIYYSNYSDQYVLDKATSTWSVKTWSGITSLSGLRIWTDGNNIYYSAGSSQYILDKATSTWSKQTWSGINSFNGGNIWTDGSNIHYSTYGKEYILKTAPTIIRTKVSLGNPIDSTSLQKIPPIIFSSLDFSSEKLGFEGNPIMAHENIEIVLFNEALLDCPFDRNAPFINTSAPGNAEIVICPSVNQYVNTTNAHNGLFTIQVLYISESEGYDINIFNWRNNESVWSDRVPLSSDMTLGEFLSWLIGYISEPISLHSLPDVFAAPGQSSDLFSNYIVIYRETIHDYEVHKVRDVDYLISALIQEPSGSSSS